MKSVLIGLPGFLGRNWLRVIIIGVTLVVINRKQVNFNVSFGAPGGQEVTPASSSGGESSPSVFTAPPPEQQTLNGATKSGPTPAQTSVVPEASALSMISGLFSGPKEKVAVQGEATPAPGSTEQPAAAPGFLERIGLAGATSPFQPKLVDDLISTDEGTVAAYIRRFSHVAQSEQKRFGIPASITLANGLLHTLAGTRGSAQQLNNYFAIPCPGVWDGPCRNLENQNLRQYETAWLSFRNHSLYVTTGRFAPLQQFGPRDYQKWAAGLEELGYNGTPDLRKQLVTTIEQYELYRFD
ncbi:glucosaminidase domain-containing protein [Lewinella sp. 4G2]|uniref:glucosaminidase domain-containing protein n=1 Tax=Lewinella sp. 4G2 TaxID=1803372 RepID=UPI0007B4A59E|nr:glucosaminidase domain-containing protein [Lewinella sp. 4G2]OAV43119.1 hypothetical protein A3850_000795 [Lewinella sp. 4G2]